MRFFRRGIPNVERMRERGDIEGLVRALSHEDAEVRHCAALELTLAVYDGEFASRPPVADRDQVAEVLIGG